MKNYLFKLGILLILIFILTGCTIKSTEDPTMEDKISEEMEYIEDLIFNITNKYAKGEYDKTTEITAEDGTTEYGTELDFEEIMSDEKKINDVLDTIILDLSEVYVESDRILEFSNTLNNLLIVTAEKREDMILIELSNLYSLIPEYLSKLENNSNEVSEKEIKNLSILCFANANNGNFEEALNNINSALEKYVSLMNNVEYIEENSYRMNKTYVLLGEIKNATELQNENLIALKYVNFIENF